MLAVSMAFGRAVRRKDDLVRPQGMRQAGLADARRAGKEIGLSQAILDQTLLYHIECPFVADDQGHLCSMIHGHAPIVTRLALFVQSCRFWQALQPVLHLPAYGHTKEYGLS